MPNTSAISKISDYLFHEGHIHLLLVGADLESVDSRENITIVEDGSTLMSYEDQAGPSVSTRGFCSERG